VVGETVYDIAELTADARYASVLDVLEDWDNSHPAIEASIDSPRCAGHPISTVRLHAPVSRPGSIYCVGANYRDHAEEMRVAASRAVQPDPRSMGLKPFFFIKSSHSVADPGVSVSSTEYTQKLDWEVELVVVIGRKARNLHVDDALGCVAGYTVGNDLSARDLSTRQQVPTESLFRADWLRHKSFDNSAPMGPWMTPAAYIADPSNLQMQLSVNGVIKQDSNTSAMIYSAAEQIAHLSSGITLYPGDLIMTGTPAGVGAGRNEFLHAGDSVTMTIAEIGQLTFSVA
jgi:2-keto-4-pentenoate hydratase/2-oxohepta-3-ene-1,7-dioic acid hydratase in catechol pathway